MTLMFYYELNPLLQIVMWFCKSHLHTAERPCTCVCVCVRVSVSVCECECEMCVCVDHAECLMSGNVCYLTEQALCKQ